MEKRATQIDKSFRRASFCGRVRNREIDVTKALRKGRARRGDCWRTLVICETTLPIRTFPTEPNNGEERDKRGHNMHKMTQEDEHKEGDGRTCPLGRFPTNRRSTWACGVSHSSHCIATSGRSEEAGTGTYMACWLKDFPSSRQFSLPPTL